ncbi:uncharacterized protein LOC107620930 [Arachis ipaensis]|uniref:uncharacterized protein LOC107620930 n=1 Tax=Arachis ipaensis TaxID=130454 RepID=UPI0007AFB74C|nr:uncharacterized protein LOC107620930 [Arachis ipaensis]
MPYPQRLQKASKDKQFSKFLEVFRKLQINIPFAEALEQMPLYAKFMKELLSNKRDWKESETVPTRISLQLADHSNKYPLGVVENLLVKVGPFIFSADFIILDMEEDKNASIILGRPFLATGRALINVQKGELTLRINEDEIVLNVLQALQHPNESKGCMRVDMIDPLIEEAIKAEKLDDVLDSLSKNDLLEIDDSPC